MPSTFTAASRADRRRQPRDQGFTKRRRPAVGKALTLVRWNLGVATLEWHGLIIMPALKGPPGRTTPASIRGWIERYCVGSLLGSDVNSNFWKCQWAVVTRISKRSAWTIDHGQFDNIVEDERYAPEKTIATRLSGTTEPWTFPGREPGQKLAWAVV